MSGTLKCAVTYYKRNALVKRLTWRRNGSDAAWQGNKKKHNTAADKNRHAVEQGGVRVSWREKCTRRQKQKRADEREARKAKAIQKAKDKEQKAKEKADTQRAKRGRLY